MADYDSGFLLEINSHSLFSKWFSESGKLVMKLFDHINEIADDPQSFVCILIGKQNQLGQAGVMQWGALHGVVLWRLAFTSHALLLVLILVYRHVQMRWRVLHRTDPRPCLATSPGTRCEL
jgi:hypothetical protein